MGYKSSDGCQLQRCRRPSIVQQKDASSRSTPNMIFAGSVCEIWLANTLGGEAVLRGKKHIGMFTGLASGST
jgi:hypothetical protein